jgi:hypothetical protein
MSSLSWTREIFLQQVPEKAFQQIRNFANDPGKNQQKPNADKLFLGGLSFARGLSKALSQIRMLLIISRFIAGQYSYAMAPVASGIF